LPGEDTKKNKKIYTNIEMNSHGQELKAKTSISTEPIMKGLAQAQGRRFDRGWGLIMSRVKGRGRARSAGAPNPGQTFKHGGRTRKAVWLHLLSTTQRKIFLKF